jgi:hypothetical protein
LKSLSFVTRTVSTDPSPGPLAGRRGRRHRVQALLGGGERARLEKRVAADAEFLRRREEHAGDQRADHDDRPDRDREGKALPSLQLGVHESPRGWHG